MTSPSRNLSAYRHGRSVRHGRSIRRGRSVRRPFGPIHRSIGLAATLALFFVFSFAGATEALGAPPDQKKPKRVSSTEARKAVKAFEAEFAREDFPSDSLRTMNQVKAVRELSKVDHKTVAKALVKHVKAENPKVWNAVVAGLGEMKSSRVIAEKALRSVYRPDEDPPARTARIIESLGHVGGSKTAGELIKLLSHAEDEIALGAIRALANLGDRSVLRDFREFYKINSLPLNKGISVRVDTGGDSATEAAKAKREADRLQKLRRKDRAKTLAACNKMLTKLTGEKIENPKQLDQWMRSHRNAWR